MAFMKFLIVATLFAAVQAGFKWVDDDDDDFFRVNAISSADKEKRKGFKPLKMSKFFYQPIEFPDIPEIQPLPPIPPMPPMPPMRPMPSWFPVPHIPTPAEIANHKPEPDQVYSGVAVKSKSGFKTDKDGKKVRTGGAVIVTNNDGDVKEVKAGDNPPDINEPIIIPELKMPEMPKMPEIKMPAMPKMPKMPEFKPIVIPTIDPDAFSNYQPKDNEQFVSVSTSSFSHSSDINGKKSGGGGSDTVVNVNGAVDKESVRFGQKPK